MRSKIISTNIEALRLVSKHAKFLFSSIVLYSIFSNLTSFVTIYMSELTVNEIAGAREIRKLVTLVLVTIFAYLVIVLLGALFVNMKNDRLRTLKMLRN